MLVGTLIPEEAIKPLSTMLAQDWADKSKPNPAVAVHSMVDSKSQLLTGPMQRLSSLLPEKLAGQMRSSSAFSAPQFRLNMNNGNLVKSEPMMTKSATPQPIMRVGTPPVMQSDKTVRVPTPPVTRVSTPPNAGHSLLATPPPTPTSTATPSEDAPPPPPLLSMPIFLWESLAVS